MLYAKCTNAGYLKQIKTGERNDYKPALIEGKYYPINETIYDTDEKGVEHAHYDVGLKSNLSYIRSIYTGENLDRGDSIHWAAAVRFDEPVELTEAEVAELNK